ncbi:hypothetical protein FQR65_LT13018 [Abscondita terminalis]|nr:hypothetical protein FQR65_LT13018 [Abscondita terminalis]
MITSVMDKMFTEDDTLVFIYDDEFLELELPDVIQNQYVIGSTSSPTTLVLDKPGSFIIHLSDEENLIYTRNYLFDSGFFESIYSIKGSYLVILNEKKLTNINRIFHKFWRYENINRVVVLTYNTESEVFGKVYTSDPLHEKNVCGRETKVVQCKVYNRNISIKFKNHYRNIHQCWFMYLWPQFDDKYVAYIFFDKIFDVLGKKINGSYYRHLNQNSSVPSITKQVTLLLQLQIGKTAFSKIYDILNFGFSDPVYFVVRSGEKISSVKLLMIVFSTEVWIFIIVTYIATSLTLWIVLSIEKKKFFISHFAYIFLEVFSATLWGCFSLEPKKTKIRCVFICYLFYHIHIYTGFTSNLVTILTTPQFETGISNLKELADSNFLIYSRTFHQTLFDINDEDSNRIRDKIEAKMKFQYNISYDSCVELLMRGLNTCPRNRKQSNSPHTLGSISDLYLFNFWSGSLFVKMSGLPDVDVDRMISSVQSKPVLWDKTSEKYKDKFKTQEAWKEVCEEISNDYGELDDTKKIEFGILRFLEDFDELDTLDFQMEVLKVIKKIRDRKHPLPWRFETPYDSPSSTPSMPSPSSNLCFKKTSISYLESRNKLVWAIAVWLGIETINVVSAHTTAYLDGIPLSNLGFYHVYAFTILYNGGANFCMLFILAELKLRICKLSTHGRELYVTESQVKTTLKFFKHVYDMVWAVAKEVFNIFKVLLLCQISMYTIFIIVGVFWFSTSSYNGQSVGWFQYGGTGLWVVLTMLEVTITIHFFAAFSDEVVFLLIHLNLMA